MAAVRGARTLIGFTARTTRRNPPTREGWWFLIATLLVGVVAIDAGINLLVLGFGVMISAVLAGLVLSELGLSVEFATDIQLNHVPGVDYEMFYNVRAAWIAPAVQIHVDDWQIDLIARIGLTRGQELYGVLEYVGTSSYTVRVGRNFN